MIKVGTIGTGTIVENFIKAVNDNEGIKIEAVYSRKLDKAKSFGKKFNINTFYENLDEMFKDENLDVIYIASPNSLHYEQCKKALLANKHVILEKPFTSTVKETIELIELAKEKHLFLFEAITTIHLPHVNEIKEMLKDLGTMRMVQCNFSQYSSKYDAFLAGENPNVFTPEFSGGALSDINIYNLHFVTWLFGKPDEIHYYANICRTGVDTSGILILKYKDFLCTCVACKDSKSDCILQIQGEKGYIRVDSQPSRVMNINYFTKEKDKYVTRQKNDNALFYEVSDFVEILNNKDYDLTYKLLDHTLMVMKLYEDARLDAGIHFKADNK